MLRVLAVALCCSAALAETPAATTLVVDAFKGSTFVNVAANSGFEAGMSFKIGEGTTSETRKITNTAASTQGTAITFEDALENDHDVGAAFAYYEVPKPTEAPIAPPAAPTTTTLTGWDSSASSGSDSLGSLNSGSLHAGSSGSDLSGSASSGSTASGSWGSFLQFWQWLIVAIVLCFCFIGCAGGASMGKKKPKKKSKKAAAPAPVVEEVLPELAPLMPLMPGFQNVTYAAPMTYAQPQMMATSAYATPQYAMPATTSYAMPATTAYTTSPAVYVQ